MDREEVLGSPAGDPEVVVVAVSAVVVSAVVATVRLSCT